MEDSVSIEMPLLTTALSGPEEILWALFHTKEEAGHLGGSSTIDMHPCWQHSLTDLQSLKIICSSLGLTEGWEGHLRGRSSLVAFITTGLCEPEICRT